LVKCGQFDALAFQHIILQSATTRTKMLQYPRRHLPHKWWTSIIMPTLLFVTYRLRNTLPLTSIWQHLKLWWLSGG